MQFDKTAYNMLLRNWPQYETLRIELMKFIHRKVLNQGSAVDCYVDLDSYLSNLYSRTDYFYDEPGCICSSIINYVAHLRHFFMTRFYVNTRFFLVLGSIRPAIAATMLGEFNVHNQMTIDARPDVTENLKKDLELVDMLAKYIPDVYYIEDQNAESAVLIREIIKDESANGHKNTRFIFTKDRWVYQLACTCPNTHIIRVKKTMQGDQTYTISYFDFYKKLNRELKLKNPIGEGISPELYSLYMTFAGCKDCNVKGLINYPKTDTMIKTLVGSHAILNSYNHSLGVNVESYSAFCDALGLDYIQNAMKLFDRYRALDLLVQASYYATHPSRASLMRNVVDLYDPKSVQQINNQFFHKYPLDLNVL